MKNIDYQRMIVTALVKQMATSDVHAFAGWDVVQVEELPITTTVTFALRTPVKFIAKNSVVSETTTVRISVSIDERPADDE